MHDELRRNVMDHSAAILYMRKDREFGIYYADIGETVPLLGIVPPRTRWTRKYEFQFCPWSGEPLMGSLGRQWFDVAIPESGLNRDDFNILDEDHYAKLHSKFMTEEWWIELHMGPSNPALSPDWIKPKPVPGIIVEAGDPMPRWAERPLGMVGPEVVPPQGFRRFRGHPPHFCEQMAYAFEDVSVMIAYIPCTREYGIRLLEVGKPVDDQAIRIRAINYCPWCGDKLPESVRPQWMAELQRHGLSAPPADVDALPPAGTPADLASENWWRTRGL